MFAAVADPVGMGLASNIAHPDREHNRVPRRFASPGSFNAKAFGIAFGSCCRRRSGWAAAHEFNE